MSKKGGAQQLQAEINTNDELLKFLERDGLLVFDVYSEWCGPCLAMVGSLKKIKLEQGGDDLHLAIVKSDNIDVFKRFKNKSEPIWLLVSKKKLVNSAFGANVPALMNLIMKELEIERTLREENADQNIRVYFALDQMTPVELIRYNGIQRKENEYKKIEMEAAKQRRNEFLCSVTNKIMRKLDDLGVTLFMPHVVSRDLFKRVTDIAEKCQLTARDKKTIQIKSEHLDAINLECTNPLSQNIIDHIVNKDVFMVCWKLTDMENLDVESHLIDFVNMIWKDDDEDEQNNSQSLLKAFIKEIREVENENKGNEDKLNIKKVIVPPVWAPENKRTNAMFIYLYFRSITETFLPPDPPAEIPHIAMAFDAYKRKELMEIIEKNRDDILAYGYFTSDRYDKAEIIATSTYNYQQKPPSILDKFVLKVAKREELSTISILKEYGPSYISEHAEIGRAECLSFFPPGYKNSSETGETTPVPSEQPKKKKKKRKARNETDAEANGDGEIRTNEDASNEIDGGDDSGKNDDDDCIEDDEDIENEATDELNSANVE